MVLLEVWLSYFVSYVLASFNLLWRRIKGDQGSRLLLLLPPEILLEIFQYLDYCALIDTRQVC